MYRADDRFVTRRGEAGGQGEGRQGDKERGGRGTRRGEAGGQGEGDSDVSTLNFDSLRLDSTMRRTFGVELNSFVLLMPEGSHIRQGFFDRAYTFGRMIKFSHSIFALPFALVSGIVVVSMEQVQLTWLDVLLLLLCMVSARTAAIGFNRIADRGIDAENPRTKNRELPSGTIQTREAWLFTGIATIVFIGASFGINLLCGILSIPLLALLYSYSLTKRYTWASHIVLGACLGAAPIGVWFALTGSFHSAPILLGLGVTLWTAGFDIYYSLQDQEFDREKGLQSVPARFGKWQSLWIARFIHFLAVVAYAGFGVVIGLSFLYWIGLATVAGILVYEAWLLRKGDLSKIDLAFFTMNGYVSILFAVAVAVDMIFL